MPVTINSLTEGGERWCRLDINPTLLYFRVWRAAQDGYSPWLPVTTAAGRPVTQAMSARQANRQMRHWDRKLCHLYGDRRSIEIAWGWVLADESAEPEPAQHMRWGKETYITSTRGLP